MSGGPWTLPLIAATSSPKVTQGKREKRENSHSLFCSHNITNTGNKLPTTKLIGIWSETCQHRSAWLGSQSSYLKIISEDKWSQVPTTIPTGAVCIYAEWQTWPLKTMTSRIQRQGREHGLPGKWHCCHCALTDTIQKPLVTAKTDKQSSRVSAHFGVALVLTLQSVHVLTYFYEPQHQGKHRDTDMQ